MFKPLVLALITVGAASAQAQGAAADPGAQRAPAATPAPSSGTGAGLASRVDNTAATGGAAQQSWTPSYELAGIGRRGNENQEVILTAAGLGTPIRFDNGVFVYLSGGFGIGHNDNVVGTSTDAISSTVYSLQPSVVAEMKKSGDRYTLAYSGNYTRYASSGDDNFNHHDLVLAGDNYYDIRNKLGWSVSYFDRTDPRGSTDRSISAEPDHWTAPQLRLQYTYGADGAPGRIQGEFLHLSKRYQNNRLVTEFADVDSTSLIGRFLWRVAPATSAIVEGRLIRNDYTSDLSTGDNLDTRLLVGAVWEATAKTSGSIKAGYQRKNFSSAARNDVNRFTYELAGRWEPRTYSVVELVASRTADDSTGFGDYIKNNNLNLVWTHEWKTYLSSRVSLGNTQANFVGGDRRDTINNLGLGMFYDFGGRYSVGVQYNYTRRNSNITELDFKRNVFFVTLEAAL